MKLRMLSAAFVAVLGLFTSAPASAALDNNAAEVLLRLTCTDNGATLNNCFTSITSLESWIWGTRKPKDDAPLHVRIGPGAFAGTLSCTRPNPIPGSEPTWGHTTYTGAGVNNTVISGHISSKDCHNMTYESLSVHASSGVGVATVGGLTWWNDVEVIGEHFGYWDAAATNFCSTIAPGKHYWFSSRIVSRASAYNVDSAAALYWECPNEQVWLYGTEITSASEQNWDRQFAIWALAGEVHVYGGVIRNVPKPGKNVGTLHGVVASGSELHSEIHIHGTGIDVIDPGSNDVIALMALEHGHIHANSSSYVLKTSGGTVTRIQLDGDGEVMAPYLWQNGTPPAITSTTGADMVVWTDGGGTPHLLIYKAGCTSKWYDTKTNACY